MKIVRATIPRIPGIYLFRNKIGKILYIGKAVNLRARVASYFNKQPKDSRISKMLELAAKVDWQETGSEIEALILESQFIKKYRPPFNVMLRDDKQYFYVGFASEIFPKVFITHQPISKRPAFSVQRSEKISGSKKVLSLNPEPYTLNPKYVGPFTDGGALKTTLRLLRRVFPYCTCRQKHNNYCLNYHIGKCLGFCCLKNGGSSLQRREYLKNIKAITSVLEGKKPAVIKNFKKEMLALGNKHSFEKAIELRDKIDKLEKVFENARIISQTQPKYYDTMIYHSKTNSGLTGLTKLLGLGNLPRRIEGYDISNIQGKFAAGAMVVFRDGRPDKSQYRKFKIRLGDEPNDLAMLREVLTRRFNHSEWQYPDLIIIDGGVGQLNAALLVVPQNIPVLALTKDEKHRGHHIFVKNKKTATPLIKMPEPVRNLILQVDAEAHRFAISYYRKLHRRLK